MPALKRNYPAAAVIIESSPNGPLINGESLASDRPPRTLPRVTPVHFHLPPDAREPIATASQPPDHAAGWHASSLRRILRLSLGLAIVIVAGIYGALHWSVLQIPYPITQDEPGFVEITAAPNPYAPGNLERCGSVYGPGYAFFARPFAALMANPYIAHRWANTVALGLMLALLVWQLRRVSAGWLETGAAVVIVYALNVSSHSLAASADFLAAALCFGAIVAGRHGNWPALAGCILLTVLGSLTKLYAAFGWLVVASHLIVFAPRRKALIFVGGSVLTALFVAALLQLYAPGYFLSTFVVHWAATTPSFAIFRDQTLEFLLLGGGLAVLAAWGWPRRRSFSWSAGKPLAGPAIDIWFWAALWATLLLAAKLGWHAGNYLVYYYHLLLVPLAIVAARRCSLRPLAGPVLLMANLLVLIWQFPPLPGRNDWNVLEWNVAQVTGPVLAEPLLAPFQAANPKLELFEHGQTASILQALDHLGPAAPTAYQSLHRTLLADAQSKIARIKAREFAAIYIAYQQYPGRMVWSYDRERYAEALKKHYQPVTEIRIFPYCAPFWDRMQHGRYAYHILKWVPKSPGIDGGPTAPTGP
jgi:hypothetical protein